MAGRRRKKKGHGLASESSPSLTSLIDILMVVLVFLLKTFAISPITVRDPSVQLPISTSHENVEDLVVVMISGAERRDKGPRGENILTPNVPTIVVDDDVIVHLGQNFEVPEGELERQFVIRKLKQRLIEERRIEGKTAELIEQGEGSKTSEGFTGKIVFVVDKNVPFRTLSRALVSSAEAGYADFKFAIVKSEG